MLFLLDGNHRATSTLDEWSQSLLELDLLPLIVIKMADNHLINVDVIFSLPTVDKHTFLVDGGNMILARTY